MWEVTAAHGVFKVMVEVVRVPSMQCLTRSKTLFWYQEAGSINACVTINIQILWLLWPAELFVCPCQSNLVLFGVNGANSAQRALPDLLNVWLPSPVTGVVHHDDQLGGVARAVFQAAPADSPPWRMPFELPPMCDS
jgi:hypothetical protein